ncbi:hypothetical protein BH11PSE10_BH11PSE10_12130 [soil metagenome]
MRFVVLLLDLAIVSFHCLNSYQKNTRNRIREKLHSRIDRYGRSREHCACCCLCRQLNCQTSTPRQTYCEQHQCREPELPRKSGDTQLGHWRYEVRFLRGLPLPITGLRQTAKLAVAIPVDWRVSHHLLAHMPMSLFISISNTCVGVSPVFIPICVCESDHITSPSLNCRWRIFPSGSVIDLLNGANAYNTKAGCLCCWVF